MREIIFSAIATMAIPSMMMLVIKNKLLWKICDRAGVIVSAVLVTRLGEKLENWGELTFISATDGFVHGLRRNNIKKAAKKIIKLKKAKEVEDTIIRLKKKSPL